MVAPNSAPTFPKDSTVEQFKAFQDYVIQYWETYKFTAEPKPVWSAEPNGQLEAFGEGRMRGLSRINFRLLGILRHSWGGGRASQLVDLHFKLANLAFL